MKTVTYIIFIIVLCARSSPLLAHQGNYSQSPKIHSLAGYYIENRETAENWIEGFSTVVSGEKIKYHSSDPSVTQALIARASDGKSSVCWKTSPIPTVNEKDMLTFVWLTGIGCNIGEFLFDLKIDGKHWFTFSTKNSHEWSVQGNDDIQLKFQATYKDKHGDLFGYMFLNIPRSLVTDMGSIEIEVTGHNSGSSAWYMAFTYGHVVKDFVQAGRNGFFYRLILNEKSGTMNLYFPLNFSGKQVRVKDYTGYEFQSVLNKVNKFSEAVIKSEIQDLVWPIEIMIDDNILDIQAKFSGENDSYEETVDGGVIYRSWSSDLNEQVIQSSKHFFIDIPEHRLPWPEYVQEFPVLSLDSTKQMWMAVIERLKTESSLAVYLIEKNDRKKICMLQPENMSGISAAAITGFKNGCFVAFPVEKDGRWLIAYTYINANSPSNPDIDFIKSEGTSNISPSVAVSGNQVCVVWESNSGQARGIYACLVDTNGTSMPRRISSSGFNSYNPSVVSLADRKFFVAWDSYRNETADIWAAQYSNGKWEEEFRVSSGPRIDRHPSLAVHANEVWITWQAQSYGNSPPENNHPKNIALNHVDEQRIVVAQIQEGQLKSPLGLFEQVSPKDKMLLRPRISFTSDGSLILTARESINQHDGWLGVMWTYGEDKWSDKIILHNHRGRWQPVSVVSYSDSIFSSIQFDNQPRPGYEPSTVSGDWHSAVKIKGVKINSSETIPLGTQLLKMPETNFSLEQKSRLIAADFPRQEIAHKGKTLQLFFGNFHEHTDISTCAREYNPPGHDLFANLRDIEKLDFCALTDHHNSIDKPIWAFDGEQIRNNHDPKRFVTFLGQEWSSSAGPQSFGYGHHNIIFLDPYLKSFIDDSYTFLTPAQLWEKLDKIDFVSIPHQLADWGGLVRAKGKWGNPPKDWNYYDEILEPVAEIFQSRGSYEYYGCPRQAEDGAPFSRFYLQDAWKRGIVIGVTASPDHGGGYGKTGVWAEELTRKSIFEAVRSRHTYGTSGKKMALLFRAGEAMMGDKVDTPQSSISFEVEASSDTQIKEVVIFRNNEIEFNSKANLKNLSLRWVDENPNKEDGIAQRLDYNWYYVRIQTEDDEIAWSSPIWFKIK